MYPFYYIDGPLQGQIIEGDFRPLVYYKYTFALIIKYDTTPIWYRIYCDLASITKLDKLPKEAYQNIQCVKMNDCNEIGKEENWRELLEEYFDQMELVTEGARVKVLLV